MFEKIQNDLNDAISNLRTAKVLAFNAAAQLALGNKNLEEHKAVAISTGVEGKNAEQRAANLRLLLGDRYTALDLDQNNYNVARHEAELAELELTRAKLTIRLMELSSD